MNFQTIKTSIADILNPYAVSGGFRVAPYKIQALNADTVQGANRLVQIRYNSGEFTNQNQGASQHSAVFELEFIVSALSDADLVALNDPDATDAERETALIAAQNGALLVDESMDDLFARIYQIIMNSKNRRLGLDGIVTGRSITRFEKSDPMPQRASVLLTGIATLVVKCVEPVSGIEVDALLGTTISSGIQTASIDEVIDTYTKTGVEVDP